MAEENSSPGSPHSLKYKLKSFFCLSCCFPHHRMKPRIVRSSSLHIKSRSTDFPHLEEKCHNFISRIGHQRRRHSADFHYDALSYALNFEDDATNEREVRQQPQKLLGGIAGLSTGHDVAKFRDNGCYHHGNAALS